MKIYSLTTSSHNEHHSENDHVNVKSYISLAEAQKVMRNAFIEFLDGEFSGNINDYHVDEFDYNPDGPDDNVISDTFARAQIGLNYREWNITPDEI